MPVQVEGTDEAMIELFTKNDAVTLEYDDNVILVFTPDVLNSVLIWLYESQGEYIRERVTVHIIDNDSTLTVLF